MNVEFKWNNQKASLNLQKHGISFELATTVFNDPLAYILQFQRLKDEGNGIFPYSHSPHPNSSPEFAGESCVQSHQLIVIP